MDSQPEDFDCNKTVALPKILLGSNRFIFNVTLDISYSKNSDLYDTWHLKKITAATIAGQIGHKYKEWKNCSCVIAYRIFRELRMYNASSENKNTISIHGQYVDKDSVIGYSEIIYDWFTYDGFMTVPFTDSDGVKKRISAISLQYTIRFLLSPALAVAQHVYSARGYTKLTKPSSEFWTTYEKIMNTEIDHEKEYNHLEMWRANYNAYSNTMEF
ncbi:hypothetical protein PV328_007937 [Microctonus aethiopoides]|uniref:Uncharacterized protein n=1 Tax=Microctonus aethiopoides TaxID=144406 RepID=A0AA39C9T2_9HYME|nr:hypothetical protein PV328_007937 [Microctonus aethiopoides]